MDGDVTAPLYAYVWRMLGEKIAMGELPAGAVLSEAGIARQLRVSRAPVRRALAMLAEGGQVRPRRQGGYMVGEGAPTPLSSQALSDILADASSGIGRSAAWERIFETVRAEVMAAMPFGSYRIQEADLGSVHNASRTVAREVLSRLHDHRLIEKDRRSHWVAPQMTGRDIRETFAMRRVLEPVALREVAPGLDRAWLAALQQRLAAAASAFAQVRAAEIDSFESALHETMLAGLANRRMLGSIRRNQVAMIVPRLFRARFPLRDDLETVQSLGQIVQHLLTGTIETAAVLLATHLSRLEPLTLSRLRVLSVVPPPPTAAYLVRL